MKHQDAVFPGGHEPDIDHRNRTHRAAGIDDLRAGTKIDRTISDRNFKRSRNTCRANDVALLAHVEGSIDRGDAATSSNHLDGAMQLGACDNGRFAAKQLYALRPAIRRRPQRNARAGVQFDRLESATRRCSPGSVR